MSSVTIYTKELKDEIVSRIKETGRPVNQIANEYGISPKTVYGWVKNGFSKETNILEMSKLRRENDELKKLIGELTFNLKKKR